MTEQHPMCAAGAHDYCRVIDGITRPAPVVCSRCGEPPGVVHLTDEEMESVKDDEYYEPGSPESVRLKS